MGASSELAAAKAAPLALYARCGLALALGTYYTWLLNNGVFPTTSETYPLAREFQTAAGTLLAVAVALAARRRPSLAEPAPAAAGALALTIAGSALLLSAPESAWGVTLGLVLAALGHGWFYYPLGLCLARLGAGRRTFATVAGALLAGTALGYAAPAPGYAASVVLLTAIGTIQLLAVFSPSRPALEALCGGQAVGDLALVNPQSFLALSHRVYVLMAIFAFAFGFALSLNISQHTPVSSWLNLLAVAGVTVWFLLASSGPAREDALFAVAALLVVAGLLAVPVASLDSGAVANGLLYAGNSCFSILSWAVLASLCARNPSGALFVLACGGIASGLGTFVGADLGHLVNLLLAVRSDAASAVTGAAVLLLFGYVLVGLRGFSIAETIRGVVPAVPVSPAPAAPSRDDLFAQRCRELAEKDGLTAREREVMELLAHGRDSRHIQEALTLSYNTVKTHVKRIYRKLDVHSQQELIDLIEEGVDAPNPDPRSERRNP